MKRDALSSAFGLALLIGGCPKRHVTYRVDYVPPPPPQPAPTASSGTLVIEEPTPPENAEEEVSPAEAPAPATAPARKSHRPRRSETETPDQAPAELSEPQPAAPEVPTLEPGATAEQQAALRRQIGAMQGDAHIRIARLDGVRLSSEERRTLNDAITFLAQSSKALDAGDMQRASTLARKALLLVAAVEKNH